MTSARLLEPSSVLLVGKDAVRVKARGPISPKFYDQIREGVLKARFLDLPLMLQIDGGEGLDPEELDGSLSYFRMIQSRGETYPLVIQVNENSFARLLLPQLRTAHIVEIHLLDGESD